MNVTFDWNQEDWVALPLGFKLAKLMRFGKQPVQFSGSYECNSRTTTRRPRGR